MHIRWKFWHRQSRNVNPDQDWLEHVAVGDPDPTSDHGAGNQDLACPFTWTHELSPTVLLPWCCTRERGHPGQHLAGTGEQVVAVHSAILPTLTASNVSA